MKKLIKLKAATTVSLTVIAVSVTFVLKVDKIEVNFAENQTIQNINISVNENVIPTIVQKTNDEDIDPKTILILYDTEKMGYFLRLMLFLVLMLISLMRCSDKQSFMIQGTKDW